MKMNVLKLANKIFARIYKIEIAEKILFKIVKFAMEAFALNAKII